MFSKFIEYWPFIVPVLISVLNALIDTYKGKNVLVRWLNIVIDALSVTTRKDSAGTLKVPIVQQSQPLTTTKKKK